MGYKRWESSTITARLEEPLQSKQNRINYRLARLVPSADGFKARPVDSAGSGDVLSLTRANGFIITPAGEHDFDSGAELPAMLWNDRL